MTIRDEFALTDDHDLNWLDRMYKYKFSKMRLIAYMSYVGCALLTVILWLIPGTSRVSGLAGLSFILMVYGFGCLVLIADFSYFIFDVNEQRYWEDRRAAWTEWWLYVERHLQFAMSYIIFMLLCYKLNL